MKEEQGHFGRSGMRRFWLTSFERGFNCELKAKSASDMPLEETRQAGGLTC